MRQMDLRQDLLNDRSYKHLEQNVNHVNKTKSSMSVTETTAAASNEKAEGPSKRTERRTYKTQTKLEKRLPFFREFLISDEYQSRCHEIPIKSNQKT
jgi:hypothetical protein